MEFSEKIAVITGASSGIGEDVSIEFARQGAKVVLVGRNEDRLNIVADKIKSNGSFVPLVIIADISKDASKIIEKTIKHFGQLNILVNNAGIGAIDSASTVDLDKFDRIFETNIRGVVELTKLAVPFLENTNGIVVNVSSISSIKALAGGLSYCMSKAALDMYTKCASLELAPKGIRVNSVNPGMIKTPILNTMGFSEKRIEQYRESERIKTPIGRTGLVSDTTNAILYLSSEKSTAINGISMIIDGGISNV